MQAGSLQCPQCGAAVSQTATQCQYCHTLLETVACPRCMGMMFMGTRYCPHCGAICAQLATGPATKKSCPRCRVALQTVQVGKSAVDECMTCGGLWMAVGNFDAICSDAESREAASGLKLPTAPPIDQHVRYLPCPQCGSLMARTNYAAHSGIVTNVCRAHGVWLDRGSMPLIVEFISSGGLDRARSVEIEKMEQARRALGIDRQMPYIHDWQQD